MSRRRRPDKSHLLIDLFGIAAKMPWWIGLVIAIVLFLVLNSLANMEIVIPKKVSSTGWLAFKQFVKAVASFVRYVIPGIILVGAVVSGFRQWRRYANRHLIDGSKVEPGLRGSPLLDDGHEASASSKSIRATEPTFRRVDTDGWNLELLNALEWKRFELVCSGLFQRLGFDAQSANVGADGGIDIRLFQGDSKVPVAVVQCKAWKKVVGVDVVRELRGVMASEGVAEGIFATTATFTKDAIAFAKSNNIDLMDGRRILEAIESLESSQQVTLLDMATKGDYTTPTCASCGIKLVWRTPRSGARGFWGCRNYPRCNMKIFSAGPT